MAALQKRGREIIPIEVTDEEYTEAESIVASNVDPTWNEAEWGNMFIGVTGKHQVYYTLWKYRPKVIGFSDPVHYMGNLSINIVEAAKKARKRAGIQPVYFEDYQTLKGLQGSRDDVMTGGKHRGETISEIYMEDPQYVLWIAKTWAQSAKTKKQMKQLNNAQILADDFFKSMTERNQAAETKGYFEVGKKFVGPLKVIGHKTYDDSTDYTIKAENDEFRFMWKMSLKNLCHYLGVDYTYDLIRENGTLYEIPKPECKAQVTAAVNKLETVNVRGKAKYNNEIVGKKWTRLSYVTMDNVKFK